MSGFAPSVVPGDDVTLTVAGRVYAGWTRLRVSRGIDRMCSDIDLELTELWSGQSQPWSIRPYDKLVLALGGDVVLTGYCDNFRAEIDATRHTVRVTGRSKTEDVIDCTPDLPGGEFRGYTLDQIARAICAPFGIEVVVATDMGAPFANATILRHEIGFAFLERLSRLRGVLMTDDEQGRLVLTNTGAVRADGAVTEGVNLLRGSVILSSQHRFSDYRVKVQSPAGVAGSPSYQDIRPITTPEGGGAAASAPSASVAAQNAAADDEADSADAVQTQATTTTQGSAHDPGVPRYRPHVIIAEAGLDAAGAQARATWQARYNAGRATQLEVELQGWRQAAVGNARPLLWRINQVVPVAMPSMQLQTDLLIAAVDFELDAGRGRITRLLLGPPDAYRPDPGQVRAHITRKGHGANADLYGGVASIAGARE